MVLTHDSYASILDNSDKYFSKATISTPDDCLKYLEKELNDNLVKLEIVNSNENITQSTKVSRDLDYIEKFMHSHGYYKASIGHSIDSKTNKVVFTISANRRYKYADVQININASAENIDIIDRESLVVKQDNFVNAQDALDDVKKIDSWIEQNNCLFEHSTKHQATINHHNETVDIKYIVTPSKKSTFGDINFKGNKTIATPYLETRLGINTGDCFRRSKLNKAKIKLQHSGLIKNVDIELPDNPSRDGSVPVTLNIKERDHRTIKLGLNYSTDEGIGGDAQWEHRNLFSQGEKLTVKLALQDERQNLETAFEKPYFLRSDQRLKLAHILRQEEYDSYSVTGTSVSGGVERDFKNNWTLGAGSKIAYEKIDERGKATNTSILSFPLLAKQDKRDNILNPTKGWTFNTHVTPGVDVLHTETSFVKSTLRGTYYYTLKALPLEPTVALKAATGSIIATKSMDVPASERFYSGGGGSIRGYAYQSVGPLDSKNKPLGGRSFVESSMEMRMKVAEDYGVVGFIDGGNTFDEMYPSFKGDVLWGGGVGFRYFTSFGPIRADVAVPLNKRKNVDDSYQLYFSIGQAF